MEARILLADGTLIEGQSFGATGTAFGEIVFNTGMTGYQEILTDPSYAGQVVTMTYPLIGNYGVNLVDVESKKVNVSGFIVKGYASAPSHWQMTESIASYLEKNNIIGVYDVDTRMITKKIRNTGAMNCVISTDISLSLKDLEIKLNAFEFPKNIVSQVSTKEILQVPALSDESNRPKRIGVVDLGIKSGIIKQLNKQNCDVTVYPFDVQYEEVKKGNHDAILFSNGPGDPKECLGAITLAKELKGQLPLFGICLGHQILSLCLGSDTYKLKFGHRGSNHPVIDIRTNRVYMTSQNHGYAVKIDSIVPGMTITHLNVNDNTVEGMVFDADQIASVQFHPEEGPGPTDATVIFKEWIDKVERK